jgi:ATP-binding protein involved in chromosome partitioning
MYSVEKVLEALSTVIDPDLKKDLVSLGMIQHVEIAEKQIRFQLVLTTPACPLKNYLLESCEKAIHQHVSPEAQVNIDLTSKVGFRTRNQEGEPENLRQVKNIIAVVSGKGGVGKSTVAASLAVGLALEGASVGLVDADIYGPSIPIMFGLEGKTPEVVDLGDKQLIKPLVAYGVKLVSIGFFVSQDASLMWRGPMASNYLKQMITDTEWGELDYLIFDMPPGTGDMHLTLVQTVPVTGAVIVSTPQKVALADARKAVSMFTDNKINVPVLGIVENMAYFTPPELPDNRYYLFGKEGSRKLAEEMNLKLLGEIPIVEDICLSGDQGIPAVMSTNNIVKNAFLEFCRNTAQALSIRNAIQSPTNKVELKS